MRASPKMAEYLRAQYPPGTRLRLDSMEDPYAPVEPGTTGTVQAVDDACNILMRWDNGRTLSLVPGVDRFSVAQPNLSPLKLYMPMTVDLYEQNRWGDWESEPTELSSSEAVQYADSITAAILRERMPEEAQRGLMQYYDEKDGVNQKVQSLTFSAEVRNNRLWGVAECLVAGELTPEELGTLKEYITGQASDGFGEGFEQREIRIGNGTMISAHLWNDSPGWGVQTEQEQFSPRLEEKLPALCFSVLPDTGALVCIKRGESGFYPSDWDTGDRERNRALAEYNNERLGVTEAQRLAMECGSMHGWTVLGADPATYERNESKMGGMTFE